MLNLGKFRAGGALPLFLIRGEHKIAFPWCVKAIFIDF